ncbi:MAG: ABC transporter ATP-binding protein [Bacteriovorax sp.]|nr:ABC transporter ATP-binding protein [Rhizobacter sp.]
MIAPTLSLDALRCGYGQATVVRDISLSIAAGEALALLGKNGMGKSTLLKGIMGFLPRQGGAIRVCGEALAADAPHTLAGLGVAYAPQEKSVFQDLSVEQNLRIAVPDNRRFRAGLERVAAYFPFIAQRLRQKAGTLSGGEQKMLILGRALMAQPRLLLLDEITEGLQPSVIERISGVLQAERKSGSMAMLIIEQNVEFALRSSDRFAVLERGELSAQGRCDAADAPARILHELGL